VSHLVLALPAKAWWLRQKRCSARVFHSGPIGTSRARFDRRGNIVRSTNSSEGCRRSDLVVEVRAASSHRTRVDDTGGNIQSGPDGTKTEAKWIGSSPVRQPSHRPYPRLRDQQSMITRTPGSALAIFIVKSCTRSTADTMLRPMPDPGRCCVFSLR